MVGKLVFLTNMRPDIAFVVSLVSKYMNNPQHAHLGIVKTIICYLKGTVTLGLHYKRRSSLELTIYSGADLGGGGLMSVVLRVHSSSLPEPLPSPGTVENKPA
jgi:hypothetical protein